MPDVDQLPQLEVPYPNTNGGQQFWRASGSCPVHYIYYIHIRLMMLLELTIIGIKSALSYWKYVQS